MYYYFQRFHDSSKKAWQYIAFFRACLVTILKALSYIFRQDLENATDYGLAVATSLATVLNRTFQTRIASRRSTSFDKCPQFVSKEKRQKIIGKASKKAIRRQHHNFELKQYLQIKYCHHSMELIWGVAPQAYQCTRNNINRTKALAVRPRAQVYIAQCYVLSTLCLVGLVSRGLYFSKMLSLKHKTFLCYKCTS